MKGTRIAREVVGIAEAWVGMDGACMTGAMAHGE